MNDKSFPIKSRFSAGVYDQFHDRAVIKLHDVIHVRVCAYMCAINILCKF
jgi:hypothetical protein